MFWTWGSYQSYPEKGGLENFPISGASFRNGGGGGGGGGRGSDHFRSQFWPKSPLLNLSSRWVLLENNETENKIRAVHSTEK